MARPREKGLSLEDLLDSFHREDFSPLYLFHGEEDFLIAEALDALVAHAVMEEVRAFNVDVVYGGDVAMKELIALASSFPMMAERRVVIVREADRLVATESNRDALQHYLDDPLLSTVLVLVAQRTDMRLSVFRLLQQRGVVFEAKALYENRVPEWIEQKIRRLGRSITPEASQIILAHIGTSLRSLHNEIEKLLIYVGDKKEIDAGDVSAVVGMSKSFNVFELQRAISQGSVSRSIEILERMIDSGESPIGIIAVLTRFFHRLWIVPSVRGPATSERELASVLQVNSFFVREYISAADRYTPEQLHEMFAALLEADVALKSTQEDPRLIMTALVYRLVGPKGEAAVY